MCTFKFIKFNMNHEMNHFPSGTFSHSQTTIVTKCVFRLNFSKNLLFNI